MPISNKEWCILLFHFHFQSSPKDCQKARFRYSQICVSIFGIIVAASSSCP